VARAFMVAAMVAGMATQLPQAQAFLAVTKAEIMPNVSQA
jgi:hypothetical protein